MNGTMELERAQKLERANELIPHYQSVVEQLAEKRTPFKHAVQSLNEAASQMNGMIEKKQLPNWKSSEETIENVTKLFYSAINSLRDNTELWECEVWYNSEVEAYHQRAQGNAKLAQSKKHFSRGLADFKKNKGLKERYEKSGAHFRKAISPLNKAVEFYNAACSALDAAVRKRMSELLREEGIDPDEVIDAAMLYLEQMEKECYCSRCKARRKESAT